MAAPPVAAQLGTPTGQVQLVRKCAGSSKGHQCLQRFDHPNTRWECAFETNNKEEYMKHLKNIIKRNKWKEEVAKFEKEPDPNGIFRCVYFSTDRHHVENHYHKGSSDPLTPSPQQVMRYKNYYNSMQGKQQGRNGKRWHNEAPLKDDDETDEEPEMRDFKKMKQDASLLGFLSGEHPSDPNAERELALPETHKVEDLMDSIQKKLEIPHEMAAASLDKLLKNGFSTVGTLKGLNREGWEKLELPLAIEEEFKNTMYAPPSYPAFYGMVPFAWAPGLTHQPAGTAAFWTGQYVPNTHQQPVYYPQMPYQQTYETVLNEHDATDDKKEKADADKHEHLSVMNMVTAMQDNHTNDQHEAQQPHPMEQSQEMVQEEATTEHVENGKPQ
jgi:hypothetical protein